MRQVVFFLFPDFQMLDLTGPLAVFQIAGRFQPADVYEWAYVSASGGPIRSSVGLEIQTVPVFDGPVHTFVIVGGSGVRAACLDAPSQRLVVNLASKSWRVTSVCTGAFLLAAVGLLDGKRATTHWRSAREFSGRFGSVTLEADRIFVRDGNLWTSAGITAGIDLALALVEDDLGTVWARSVAQEMVVAYRRAGGQSQFSSCGDLWTDSDRVQTVLTYVREHLWLDLSVDHLAAVVHLSPRQFSRHFVRQTGSTPAKAVERLRAEAARWQVEGSDQTVEAIALSTGFRDTERMRRAFLRWFGQPPQAIRRQVRQSEVGKPT